MKYLKQEEIYFNHINVCNLFIVFELDPSSKGLNTDFTLGNCSFGTVKLINKDEKDNKGTVVMKLGLKHVNFFIVKLWIW